MKKLSSNKGITLVILVITIIVILIIAGISISGAINGISSADDSRALTDLEKVQHAITQRYSKYKLLNDTSLIVGTKIDLSSLTDVPETINWRVFQPSTDNNSSTNLDRKYYRLGKSDMETLGLTGDYKGSSYIVNYCAGEVYDEGQKQTSDGKALYKTAISEEISGLGDEVIQDGLQVWYDAINNTGTGHSSTTKTWFDLSGNGNNAMLNNFDGTSTSGWNSNSLVFDGTNDWAKTTKEIDYKNSGKVTIELNEINGNLANNNKTTVIFESSPTLKKYKTGYCVDTNESGINHDLRFTITNSTGNYNTKQTPNDVLNQEKYNSYTFVLDTYNQNGEYIKIYHNGKKEKLISFSNANLANSSTRILNYIMYIGSRNGDSYFTKMNLSNFRVYNKALSEDEIHHNYILDKNRYGIEE